jgi:hypothetical protein
MTSRREQSPVNFRATPAFVAMLDSAAGSLKVQKSTLMRSLISEGLQRLRNEGLVPTGAKS